MNEIAKLVAKLRDTFDSGHTRPHAWRKQQLKQMKALLREGEDELARALQEDLGKAPIEAWATELNLVSREIDHMLSKLDSWAKPRRAHVPLVMQPAKARIIPEPLGVVLVIAPWNYPVQLQLLPIAFAIAAGNAVIGKPSELAPATSGAMARLVAKYMDPDAVAIVEGAAEETTTLLAERFDHIFYTGGPNVARIVMEAAAKHLTPVTLELGGKSPAIIDRNVDLDGAARRVVYGKFVNTGQTCVAPDYILVDQSVERPFVDRLVANLKTFYGDDPKASKDYGKIVNDRHFGRLVGLLDAGGYQETVIGGKDKADASARYMPPTILRGVDPNAKVMQEEIFGPILPVIPVPDVDAAISFVNAREKPLSLYVFSKDKSAANKVLRRTSSGSACVNTAIIQLAVPELPFGGVGESGMGAYHGKRGFDTFSHLKSVLDKPTKPDPPLLYPPYKKVRERLLRRVLKARG
ncbi:MAG: aldehyde dehydrogenase family protein [Actinobacteria bacterium]|nr:MAG: aldehyde dehydrogenase family protein [Actinomycetota bacterium]